MSLSLSAKDLESLFYGVLEDFYSQSLAVRHRAFKSLFTDFQDTIFLTVPKTYWLIFTYSDKNVARFRLVCFTYLA